MPVKKPLPVIFYKEPHQKRDGPVREWLQTLSRDEIRKIGQNIMVLQFRWPLGMPWVKNLDKGLWELRITLSGKIVRIIFIADNQGLVLLHGFVKKTQKTPSKELDIAKKRKNIFDFYQKEQ